MAALLGLAGLPGTISPTTRPLSTAWSEPATTTPTAASSPSVILGPAVQPPPRNRIIEDPPTVADAKLWLVQTVGPRDAACLSGIISHESRWDPLAWNRSGSGAYGLPQAKPGSKMASAGPDWRTNPITQLRWMVEYTSRKYGSPCLAWAFWVEHGWY